jgi:hypothetical protein
MAQYRSTLLFAAGSLAGGAAVLAVYLNFIAPQVPPSTVYSPADAQSVVGESPPASQLVATTPQVVPVQVPAGTCPPQAVGPATSEADGQFQLARALAMQPLPDESAFLAVAREAAQQGRQRDAEVAYIAACHMAEQATGAHSAPVADIKSQLGQHYAALARSTSDAGVRDTLLQRAGTLFSQGADAYAAALGKNASKTRMAQQRLASLADPALSDPSLRTPAASAIVVSEEREARTPDTSRLGSARTSLADRPPARSEDLGKVDSDLERLYAQARAVSSDPAGVQRRHQQALAQRSACRGDSECLRDWAAQRKRQLFEEF